MDMDTIRINEIFTAPQGEGLWTGMLMTFVRFQGCNLRCPFCDTTQAIGRDQHSSTMYRAVDRVAKELVESSCCSRVACITGGEPLIQMPAVVELAGELQAHNWKVHLETNGTIAILPEYIHRFDWIVVSPKGPRWTLAISPQYVREVKFVIPPEDEYVADLEGKVWPNLETIVQFADTCFDAFVWLQPRNNESKAIEFCLKLLQEIQRGGQAGPMPLRLGLSVQMHKFIGSK